MCTAQGGWVYRAVLLTVLGLGVLQAQPADPAELVGPPDPRLEQPPELEIQPVAPDASVVVDQSLEALLGRTSADYLLPSPQAAIRAILGFVLLLALAYVAGHPRVAEMERALGIAHLATTGLPFLLLGLIAAQPDVGVLSPAALMEITPLMTFGLGWIGLGVGMRFDAASIARLPPGASAVLRWTAILPLFVVTGVCGAAMLALQAGEAGPDLIRDALLLGAAGAVTARSAPHLWKGRGFRDDEIEQMQRLVQVERVIGICCLLAIASFFRPETAIVSWQLPGTAWLFLTIGVGFALGGVVLATLSSSREPSEALPLYLGGIAFAAGMARYLRFSALGVCFLVGVLLAAFPGRWKKSIDAWNASFERPIYFLFLTIAGALWRPGDWRGWALMAVFVLARLAARWVGAWLVVRGGAYELAAREHEWLTYAPAGALSVAIVVNAQNLFSGPRISWIVTSVIMGSVVSEALVQAVLRRPQPER